MSGNARTIPVGVCQNSRLCRMCKPEVTSVSPCLGCERYRVSTCPLNSKGRNDESYRTHTRLATNICLGIEAHHNHVDKTKGTPGGSEREINTWRIAFGFTRIDWVDSADPQKLRLGNDFEGLGNIVKRLTRKDASREASQAMIKQSSGEYIRASGDAVCEPEVTSVLRW